MAQDIGLIQWDFNLLTMGFHWQGKSVLLKGLKPSHSSIQEANQFFKKPAKRGLLLQITAQLFSAEPSQPVPGVEALLEEFVAAFEIPQSLPPSRGHEHSITLKEGTQLACGRPYKYPYFQKN